MVGRPMGGWVEMHLIPMVSSNEVEGCSDTLAASCCCCYCYSFWHCWLKPLLSSWNYLTPISPFLSVWMCILVYVGEKKEEERVMEKGNNVLITFLISISPPLFKTVGKKTEKGRKRDEIKKNEQFLLKSV
jgi:hypothetical protein